ncbi:MAG: hypothetical protein AAF217_11100 [Pseudomonadota bacterium]
MLEDHHYFSRALKRVLQAGLATAFLSGCSLSTYENKEWFQSDNRNFFESLKKTPQQKDGDNETADLNSYTSESHVAEVRPEVDATTGVRVNTQSATAVKPFKIEPEKLSRIDIENHSAACRYLRKSADSEAVIIGSPTLSASSDEDGSGSVSVGMNLLDLRKSELIRASADAKCRLHEASKKIEATLGLGVEATSFERAWAKQAYIRDRIGQMNSIKSKTENYVQLGVLTAQDANRVKQGIAELRSEMERFRADANQRRDLPALKSEDVRSRHGALIEATNDLQNIEREIRTNDAFEMSLSAGYRYNDEFNDDLQQSDGAGGFVRLNVGIRLGALSDRRKRLEEEAAGARIDAMFEENTGTVWKSGFSERATTRVIANLKKSESELTNAINSTRNTLSKLGNEEDPEILRTQLLAKLELIRMGSNRAAVQAVIKQLKTNQKNIRALSQ